MLRLSSAVHAITLSCAVSAGALMFSAGAGAQSVQKQCGDEWKAAKAAGTVPAGQKWTEYLKDCRARMAQGGAAAPVTAPGAVPATTAAPTNPLRPTPTAPVTAAPAAPMAPAPAATTAAAPAGTAAKKPMSPGRTAEIARQRQCGAEWRANKAQLQAATPGLKWPKYWSQCNTRLKAAGQ